jgi:hypothetical protein
MASSTSDRFVVPLQINDNRSTGSKISVDRKRPIQGLLGVHSRCGLHMRDTLSEGFSYFVTSIAAPVASG